MRTLPRGQPAPDPPMSWSTSSDVAEFLREAGEFLESRPLDHAVLLTEAAYLSARPSGATDQLYGWWRSSAGEVAGAFLRAPAHPLLLAPSPDEAVAELPVLLPELDVLGVDGRQLGAVMATWSPYGVVTPGPRLTLMRMGQAPIPPPVEGSARVAVADDRRMLVGWFHQMMEGQPGDPSELAYVVDDPLELGGITLWEVDGTPVAMAGRSRVVAGVTRLSAVHELEPGLGHGDAAFLAAAEAAREVARDVVVLLRAGDRAAVERHLVWGFEPVLDRLRVNVDRA